MNCTHGTLKPLHCACMVSDADCVELLLEKGAEVSDSFNVSAFTSHKDSALMFSLHLPAYFVTHGDISIYVTKARCNHEPM